MKDEKATKQTPPQVHKVHKSRLPNEQFNLLPINSVGNFHNYPLNDSA